MGISGTALSLFSSDLNDRTYRVIWRGSVSEPCPFTTGVPQGCVLGPLLFSPDTNYLAPSFTRMAFFIIAMLMTPN